MSQWRRLEEVSHESLQGEEPKGLKTNLQRILEPQREHMAPRDNTYVLSDPTVTDTPPKNTPEHATQNNTPTFRIENTDNDNTEYSNRV